MADVRIPLSASAQRALAKPIVGKGGHQTLLRRLQAQITDGQLTVSPEDMAKILRYLLSYGDGGFQRRASQPPRVVVAPRGSVGPKATEPLASTRVQV